MDKFRGFSIATKLFSTGLNLEVWLKTATAKHFSGIASNMQICFNQTYTLKHTPGLHYRLQWLKPRPAQLWRKIKQNRSDRKNSFNYPHLLYYLHQASECNETVTPFIDRFLSQKRCMPFYIAVIICF